MSPPNPPTNNPRQHSTNRGHHMTPTQTMHNYEGNHSKLPTFPVQVEILSILEVYTKNFTKDASFLLVSFITPPKKNLIPIQWPQTTVHQNDEITPNTRPAPMLGKSFVPQQPHHQESLAWKCPVAMGWIWWMHWWDGKPYFQGDLNKLVVGSPTHLKNILVRLEIFPK